MGHGSWVSCYVSPARPRRAVVDWGSSGSIQAICVPHGEAGGVGRLHPSGGCPCLNPKTDYYPWQRGTDFCGYRIWPTHLLPRKRNIRRWRERITGLAWRYRCGHVSLETVRTQVTSLLAYCKHCSSSTTVRGLLRDFRLVRRSVQNKKASP